MEANEDQNGDLQIQNLSDDEELYHSGVDYSNKADETKPVTIKSNSQHSLTEVDQESYESSDYVVTKEKIFEKTVTTTKVIRRNIPTASETETNIETEDDTTSRPTTTYEDETSDGGNKIDSNDEEKNENENENEIKTREIPNDNDNQNSPDSGIKNENGDNIDESNEISGIKSRGINENDGDNENNDNVNNNNGINSNNNNDNSNDNSNGDIVNESNDNNGNGISGNGNDNDGNNGNGVSGNGDDNNDNNGGGISGNENDNNDNSNINKDESNENENEQNNRDIDGEPFDDKNGSGENINKENDDNNGNDPDLTVVGEGIKINNNPNNDNNEFDCTYSFKANNDENNKDEKKSHKNSNDPDGVGDSENVAFNKMNKGEKSTTMNKMIRPRTAAAGKHLRNSSNPGERNAMHNRLYTTPFDKHNRYNSCGYNDYDGDDPKRCGMRGRRLKKLHFGDENPDDSEFEKELKKREALSARNAQKNAGIGKTRNSKIQDELDKIEAEKRKVIAGDISIHSTDDEKEDDDQKTNRKGTTASTSCSKGTKASRASSKASTKKKSAANKKSLKNNYRAFVSLKPSCNRYMANMWNNYIYSIHKMNILNIKKTVDNDAPKRYAHIDQKLKARQMKKEKDDEIRKNNQNILNRMIYQGKNNVGTSNLDDNNDVIEPVFRSLHADQNRRLENEMNRESMTLLKRLKEKKPYCSVEQWKKERLITEVYLRNISTYPENYPIRQKSQPKHVPPIKKNDNEELRREKSPLEQTEIVYGSKPKSNKAKRCSTTNATGSSTIRRGNRNNDDISSASSGRSQRKGNNDKHRSLSTANKDDYPATKTRKPKHRTLSESTRQSVKLYADTSINQNQVDRLFAEQKNNSKLYKVPETNTTTAFDRVLNNYEKVENDIKEDASTVKMTGNNNIKDINNEVSEDVSNRLKDNENKPPIEEIPITEIEKK